METYCFKDGQSYVPVVSKMISLKQGNSELNGLPNPRLLFVINTNTYFPGLFRVAKFFRKTEMYNPEILFAGAYPTVDRDIDHCRMEGISFTKQEEFTLGKTWLTAIVSSRWWTSLFGRFLLMSTFRQFVLDYFSLQQYLRKIRPVAIFLAADNVNYNTAAIIKLGHQLKIPSLIMPQWLASPLEPAEFFLEDPAYQVRTVLDRLIALLYPAWIYKHHDRRLLRLPSSQIIMKELFRLRPPKPWVLHSGFADIISLEGFSEFERAKSLGLSTTALRIIGSLENDLMVATQKKRTDNLLSLEKKFGLEHRPLIISALPPDFFQYFSSGRRLAYPSYRKTLEQWIGALRNCPGYNIIYSVHPSLSDLEIVQLEKFGITIYRGSIIDLLPLADLFVACISATIQWAISCGVPVLNFDLYRFRYHDYDDAGGTITVEDDQSFHDQLSKMVNQPPYLQQLRTKQQLVRKYWGTQDGLAGTRLISLLSDLRKRYEN